MGKPNRSSERQWSKAESYLQAQEEYLSDTEVDATDWDKTLPEEQFQSHGKKRRGSSSSEDECMDSSGPTPEQCFLNPELEATEMNQLMASKTWPQNITDQPRHSSYQSDASMSTRGFASPRLSTSTGPGQNPSGVSPQTCSTGPRDSTLQSTLSQPQASTSSTTPWTRKTKEDLNNERRMFGYWFPDLSKIN